MIISDPLLIDTNVLVYAHNQDSSFHKQSLSLVKAAIAREFRGVLAEQNLLEFYSIITDKKRVFKPLPAIKAQEILEDYLKLPLEVIYPNGETIKILSMLCQQYKIKNGQVFDAYLAATMLSHQINHIVTANVKDFKSFIEIKTISIEDFELEY